MKKKLIAILLILLLFSAGSYFLFVGEENTSATTNAKTTNEQLETSRNAVDFRPEDSNSHANSGEEWTMINNRTANACENGYYYITDDREFIKYFDYTAKKEVYLCNKPNCNHEDSSCSSYLDPMSFFELFVYQNHLYLVESVGETVCFQATEENEVQLSTIERTAPSIYQLNLDGTQKTKLFQCPSGVEMDMPILIKGDILYALFKKSKLVEIGTNSTTSIETERKLVKINLQSGEYEEVCDAKNRDMLSVYQNQILWSETKYKQDPEKFIQDDDGYIDNLYQSTVQLSLMNLDTLEETIVVEDTFEHLETMEVDGNCVYVLGKNSQTLEVIDLDTKERTIFSELPKANVSIEGIFDHKLQFLYYNSNSDDPYVEHAWVLDLQTKAMQEFTLFDQERNLVRIHAMNDAYYFVRTGLKMSDEYTTWAGTTQRHILETYYGLIKKEDYWNCRAQYIPMETTQD